ncbi:hypothetical protein VTO73DRAFT_628 [Trametes versicolor]
MCLTSSRHRTYNRRRGSTGSSTGTNGTEREMALKRPADATSARRSMRKKWGKRTDGVNVTDTGDQETGRLGTAAGAHGFGEEGDFGERRYHCGIIRSYRYNDALRPS